MDNEAISETLPIKVEVDDNYLNISSINNTLLNEIKQESKDDILTDLKSLETTIKTEEDNLIEDTTLTTLGTLNKVVPVKEEVTCSKCFTTSNSQEQLYTGEESLQCNKCTKNEKRIQCDMCSKTFNKLSSLKKHRRTHKCNKLSASKTRKRNHTGKGPHKCNVCFETFISSVDLRIHEIIHADEKPYKCVQCSETFARINSLKLHEKIHIRENQYEYDAFIQLSNLKPLETSYSHEKSCQCDMCTKTCKCDISDMCTKTCKCDICTKTFTTTSDSLKMFDNGKKPYRCILCSKTFLQLGSLIRHEETHPDEELCKLNEWTKKFNYLNNLKRCEKNENKKSIQSQYFASDKMQYKLRVVSVTHKNDS